MPDRGRFQGLQFPPAASLQLQNRDAPFILQVSWLNWKQTKCIFKPHLKPSDSTHSAPSHQQKRGPFHSVCPELNWMGIKNIFFFLQFFCLPCCGFILPFFFKFLGITFEMDWRFFRKQNSLQESLKPINWSHSLFAYSIILDLRILKLEQDREEQGRRREK